MKIHTLSINMNVMKKEIENNYFFFCDSFHRMLVFSLVTYRLHNYQIDAMLDQPNWNQLYQESCSRFLSNLDPRDLSHFLTLDSYMLLYADISVYLDEFIEKKHCFKPDIFNIYSIFINDDGRLEFYLRQFPNKRN